jgi:hypothetical protein
VIVLRTRFSTLPPIPYHGGVAQMVERSLSMREAQGSIPCSSTFFVTCYHHRLAPTGFSKPRHGELAERFWCFTQPQFHTRTKRKDGRNSGIAQVASQASKNQCPKRNVALTVDRTRDL